MKDFAFTYYDADAARDVSHMNRLERGAYFDFLQAQRKFGGITAVQARKVLGNDFDETWPALELILQEDEDGKFFIPWVRASIEKRKEYTQKQRDRVNKRWQKISEEKENPVYESKSGGNTAVLPQRENENEYEYEYENNIRKGGVGEKQPRMVNFELLKNRQYVESVFRYLSSLEIAVTFEHVQELLETFITAMISDGDVYRQIEDYRSHFRNWVHKQLEKNIQKKGKKLTAKDIFQ